MTVQQEDVVVIKTINGEVIFGKYKGVEDTEFGKVVWLENPLLPEISQDAKKLNINLIPFMQLAVGYDFAASKTMPFNVNTIELMPQLADPKFIAGFNKVTSVILQPQTKVITPAKSSLILEN